MFTARCFHQKTTSLRRIPLITQLAGVTQPLATGRRTFATSHRVFSAELVVAFNFSLCGTPYCV
jgi:hypothetical protein